MVTVFVDDNGRYQDESARYKLGEYRDYETAVGAAQKVVDDTLQSVYKPGMTATTLLQSYRHFGEDPFIVPNTGQFSAWEYAAARCQQLCP
jgi:hypothetical protein